MMSALSRARSNTNVKVSTAVCLALYGMPHGALAQEPPAQQQPVPSSAVLQEVVVTAQRRAQSLDSVPYSITAISPEQMTNSGVTDIAALTRQVPGLSMYDLGARLSGAVFPIIRGLNASATTEDRPFRTFEQNPVGTYIGNSPIQGYFQLDDVQRVEVLRGPQGTLYGAGALGGALRIIPNAPELGKFDGDVAVSGGRTAHADGTGFDTSAMLNVPVGDTLALRMSGKYDYQPGFISVYGILQRPGSILSGIPTLADPTDPVNSAGILTGKDDWNGQHTFTGRAALLWQPMEGFSANLAYVYAHVNGEGGPVANTSFQGGPYPLNPQQIFPAGGNYQDFAASAEPFERKTSLTSLDLSFDAGFATLSSTSSYFKTDGYVTTDATYGLVAINAEIPGYAQYYAGSPLSPRYVQPNVYADNSRTFSQEIRLVSTTGPDKLFDYVVGLFYENVHSDATWTVTEPGVPERSLAQGCTSPYYIGATYPACSIVAGPGDANFYQPDSQRFQDKSEFGELTWHVAPQAQITFGGRHFQQSFTDTQEYLLYTFALDSPPTTRNLPASKNTWKVNASYEYSANQYVYALWSQGFRRGGANALATQSFFKDSPALLTYRPDSVDNYEAGLKGHLPGGFSYSFDVFDDEWHNPQVGGTMPDGNVGVWNAVKARSTGAELDLTSPLFVDGLTLKTSAAYTDARFTADYSYDADILGTIVGKSGQQLPGSSKVSAAATINYDWNIATRYKMALSLNDTYRSAMPLSTFPVLGQTNALTATGLNTLNGSVALTHGPWLTGLYVTNLTDKRAVVSPGTLTPSINNLGTEDVINPPRMINLRLVHSFGTRTGE
jgi:outer membrane receptor protein involved in Fe transport